MTFFNKIYLCFMKCFRACRPWSIRISFPVISPKTTFRILENSEAGHKNLNIKLTNIYIHIYRLSYTCHS